MTTIVPAPVNGTPKPAVEGTTKLAEALATPEATKPTESKEQLSPRFAALARQQKELRRQQQELKAEKERLTSERSKYDTDYIPKSKIKENALAVLLENGVTYDELTKLVLEQPSADSQAVNKISEKIAKLESSLSDREKREADNAQKTYEQALKNLTNETKILVTGNPEYELVEKEEAHDAVVELIRLTFEEDGEMLTVEEASKQTEAFLLDRLSKVTTYNKIKSKLTPPPVEAETKPDPLKQAQPIKTLTNAQTTVTSKPLSARDRRERAIAAFRGQL